MQRSVGGTRLLGCDEKMLLRSRRLNRHVLPYRDQAPTASAGQDRVHEKQHYTSQQAFHYHRQGTRHPIILYQQGGLMTTLSLSFVVCEMIGRTVTIRPIRIVRKSNMVKEQQKVVSERRGQFFDDEFSHRRSHG